MPILYFFITVLLTTLTSGASTSLGAPAVPSNSDIEMAVGDQLDLALRGPSVTMTSPQIAKVKIIGHHLHVAAKKPGYAKISFANGKPAYTVLVYKQLVADAQKQIIKRQLASPHLNLELEPTKLIITGQVTKLSLWRGLQSLRRQFKGTVVIDAQPSEILLPLLREAIAVTLRARSISSAQVSMRDERLALEHQGAEKDQKQAVNEIAEEWGISAQDNNQNVELRPMVEVEITIAEIKKNSFRTLGLKMPGVYSATVLPSTDLSSAAANVNPINVELHAGIDKGAGRVIANPKLLCRSGETAHFVAGGEIPIKVASWKTSDIFWKRYGVILDITPLADSSNAISTKLITEISLIDESHKVEGIPGFLTNRIETHFDLRGSKTIALSGLIKSETGRSSSGIAGLSEIPILGDLFKSQDYRDNRTELVIFVTPRIIHPDDAPTPPAKNFFDSTDDE